mmetsp:Transcript_118554/g.340407  ORF Transcript_118554/g.340407 Transcript_118554/m.340407 type:complete len:337 (+) Transcript_118554:134-1144(+)
MAKGQDGAGGRSSRSAAASGAGPPGEAGPSHGLKILLPQTLAAAIIGKGGAVIAEMRTRCQSRLSLTDYGEVYPGTECRVLTAQAKDEEHLNDVVEQVIATLAEYVKKSKDPENMGVEGDMKLKTLMPKAAVGGIIGKGGAKIKELRDSSGAKISIIEPSGTGPGADQLVSLSGSSESLGSAMKEVNKQIQSLKDEQWFSSWLSTTGTGAGGWYEPMPGGPAAYGYGGYGGGGGRGVDALVRIAQTLPPYVMEDSRGFALSCVVPKRLVGGLIGRGGSGTKEVQARTGAKISIRDIPDDPDNRSLSISGPLASTCAAYMLMMRRYLDSEGPTSGDE